MSLTKIFRFTILTLALTTTLVLDRALAAPGCETIESCREIKKKLQKDLQLVDSQIQSLLSEITPEFDSVAIDPDDKTGSHALHLNQGDAEQYCLKGRNHLPTAKDLALLATTREAKGIRKTEHPDVAESTPLVQKEIKENKKAGYVPIYKQIYKINEQDRKEQITTVAFYYSSQGYQPPSTEIETLKFWSSDFHTVDYDTGVVARYAYIFHGDTGVINLALRLTTGGLPVKNNSEMAVKCVRGISEN